MTRKALAAAVFAAAVSLFAVLASADEFACFEAADPFACFKPSPVTEPAAADPPPAYHPAFVNSWTWPGGTAESLRRHLASTHAIPPATLASMTLENLVAIHNSDHDGLLDRTRLGAAIAPPFQASTAAASCPGGVCGDGARPFRGRLLGGRFLRR